MVLGKRKRRLLGRIFSWTLILLGVTTRIKRRALNGEFILSIYFHSPSYKLFEFCIKWLIENKFTFLSQQDVYAIYSGVKPFTKGGVIITVDDGWLTNEENIVSIANKYEVPVTIFVITDSIENGDFWWCYLENVKKQGLKTFPSFKRIKEMPDVEKRRVVNKMKSAVKIERVAMSVDQIKSISKSHYVNIGAHTVSHPFLIQCKDDESYTELKSSKDTIEQWIGKPVNSFAYPNGDYSLREIKYLQELGYNLSFTTVPKYLTKTLLENIYELPRFEVFEDVSEQEAICRMLGIWQQIFSKQKVRYFNLRSNIDYSLKEQA